MSTDHETTTPEAAAQYEADRTPYYDERWDEYEPDVPGRTVAEHDPALVALLHDCARRAHRLMHGEAS